MTDPTPSETLRAAAARLRAGSPLISPVLVEPLAAWLDVEIDRVEAGYVTDALLHALAFAHSILEQQP